MITHAEHERRPGPGEEASTVRLTDVLAILLRQWKLIVGTAVAAVLATALVLMLTPRAYVASSVMVPFPEEGGSRLAGLAAQLPAGLGQGMAAAGSSPGSKLIQSIVQSRALQDTVRARVAPAGGARRRQVGDVLGDGLRIKSDAITGTVEVTVRAPDPRLAAEIANALPVAINDIAATLRAGGAAYRQSFMENQLTEAREKLVSTEQRLAQFQNARGTTDLQEQGRQTVQAAADLSQAISEQEVRVGELRRSLTPGHPRLQAAEAELATRRAQLRRLTQGRAGNPVFVPLQGQGELRTAAARLLREFAADEQIYLSLTAAVANSRIDANNRLPALAVLDRASVPTEPTRGPVTLLILGAGMLGLWMGMMAAFMREHLRRSRATQGGGALSEAWSGFRGDLARLVPGGRRRERVSD